MPVDADGNRADIITGPESVPGRMNLGRLHSPYFAAAARDVRKRLLEIIGYDRNYKGKFTEEALFAVGEARLNAAISELLEYYKIVSPLSYKEFTEVLNDSEKFRWMLNIFNDNLYNFMPLDDPERLDEKIFKIENRFKLTYGPVMYTGHSGKPVMTNNKVRIAPIPIMLLDKIADSWLATASGKHSNFGILTARVRADKYMRPWKVTPPRVVGETEGRIYAGYTDLRYIAEMMDRNGNIATQRELAKNIYASSNPMQIPKLVSRAKFHYGNTRPLQVFNQVLFCMGVGIKHVEEKHPNTSPYETRFSYGKEA